MQAAPQQVIPPPPAPPQPETKLSRTRQFHKFQPPVFKGVKDPVIADEWILQIEKIMKHVGSLPDEKTELATFMLQGKAEH